MTDSYNSRNIDILIHRKCQRAVWKTWQINFKKASKAFQFDLEVTGCKQSKWEIRYFLCSSSVTLQILCNQCCQKLNFGTSKWKLTVDSLWSSVKQKTRHWSTKSFFSICLRLQVTSFEWSTISPPLLFPSHFLALSRFPTSINAWI